MQTHDSRQSGIGPQDLAMALFGAAASTRVLVADDDPLTAQLLRATGESLNYQVVSVDDGRKAYRILKSDADFAAAIFNMSMPHLRGVDIVRYMKTEKRLMRIPVIIVAGDRSLGLVTESFAAGALALLPKPFTTEKLAMTLRLAIGSRAAREHSDERMRKLAA